MICFRLVLLFLCFVMLKAATIFSENEMEGWFAQCNSTTSVNTNQITIWSREKFNKFVERLAAIQGTNVKDVVIDDRCIRGFVFCCSFVSKQTITSIRSTVFYGLVRALREDKWTESQIKSFSDSYLTAVKQLKVSDKCIPSTKEIDPALTEDLLIICNAIPDCLLLKPIVTSVLSLSLGTGARSVTLANIKPCDILQCIQVNKCFSASFSALLLHPSYCFINLAI